MPQVHFVELSYEEASQLAKALRNEATTLALQPGQREMERKALLRAARDKVSTLTIELSAEPRSAMSEVKLDSEELIEAQIAVLQEVERVPDPENEDSKARLQVLETLAGKLEKAVEGYVNPARTARKSESESMGQSSEPVQTQWRERGYRD